MRRIFIAAPMTVLGLLLAASGCANSPATPSSEPSADGALGTATETSTATAEATATTGAPGGGTTTNTTVQWPSPLDCISYNPNAITVNYAAGVWAVKESQNEIVRVYAGPSDNSGQKALALAKRYKQVCFIGRGNYRDDKDAYIFEYWRNPSGINTTIPDSEDDCSGYNRNNLDVNDMGGGDGWRVKDHDHVLQIFDHEADAKNGKIVLAKYNQICYIHSENGDVPADITYS
jgi:hypothetical protein